MRRYRIVERVTFRYVWIVDAESPAKARQWCREHGDGESVDQAEGTRRFLSTEDIGPGGTEVG